jgi:transcriptional regulator with XRE-family HTH domain
MDKTDKRTPAEKLRSFRLQSKFTREQMNQMLAISLEDYILFETGHRPFTQQFSQDLADLFGKEVSFWQPSGKKPKASIVPISSAQQADDE